MNFNNLIGLDLDIVENKLKSENIKYIIKETIGFKDQEILNLPKVIRIDNQENSLCITVTYFSSSLEG